jgi:hypothetical protein
MIQNQQFEQASLYSLANALWTVCSALVHTAGTPQIATEISEDIMAITLQSNNPFYLAFSKDSTYTFNTTNDIMFAGGNLIIQLYVPHGVAKTLYLHTRAVTTATVKLVQH